eukprot:185858_1
MDEFNQEVVVLNDINKIKIIPKEGTNRPLIVVVDDKHDINMVQNTTKLDKFKQYSKQQCITDFDCVFCSYHGAALIIILYLGLQGLFSIFLLYTLQFKCSANNIHDLDDILGPNFNYSCNDFHKLLYLLSFDGILCFIAIITSVAALIKLNHYLLYPIVIFSAIRMVVFVTQILIYRDFVNIFAIVGILYSIASVLIFYKIYKIMQMVNVEWKNMEM